MHKPARATSKKPHSLVEILAKVAFLCGVVCLVSICLPWWQVTVAVWSVAIPLGAITGVWAIGIMRWQRDYTWLPYALLEVVIGIPFFGVLFLIYPSLNEYASYSMCMTHQKQLAVAVQMYAQEHGDRFPSSLSVLSLAPKTRSCPLRHSHGLSEPIAYVYNAHLAGLHSSKLLEPENTVLTADGLRGNTGVFTQSGELGLRQHHKTWCVTSFVDGHTEYIKESDFNARLVGKTPHDAQLRIMPRLRKR